MKNVERLGSIEGLLSLGERVVKWAPLLIGTTASGWLAGWAAKATSAFSEFSPFSWVGGALLGALVFLACSWLWAATRLQLVRMELASERAAKGLDAVNPLEDVFTKKRIDLNTFRGLFMERVKDKKFVNCELVGPIVVMFGDGCALTGSSIGNCEFIRVKSGQLHVPNCTIFENVLISGGSVRGVTFLIPERVVATVNAGISNLQWLTH